MLCKAKLEIEESSFIPEPGICRQPYAPASLPATTLLPSRVVCHPYRWQQGRVSAGGVTYPDDTPDLAATINAVHNGFVPGGGGVSGAVPPSTNYNDDLPPAGLLPRATIHPAIGADTTDPAVYIEYNRLELDLILVLRRDSMDDHD